MKEEIFDMPAWRDKWLSELDGVVPNASRELLDAPIATEAVVLEEDKTLAEPREKSRVSLWQRLNGMPRWVRGMLGACAMLVAIIAIVLAFGNKPKANEVFIIEVNPSMLLIAEDGVVKEVKSLGTDADVLLSTSEFNSLVLGKEPSAAIIEYVELCVKYGYFDPEGDALRLSLDGELGKLGEKIERGLAENGLYGAVVLRALSSEELITAIGLEAGGVSDIFEMPMLFRERVVEALDESELAKSYEEMVLFGELMDYIISTSEKSIERLRAHADALDKLWVLDEKIITHGDNPISILSFGESYFDLIKGEHEYTEEFGKLMQEMQTMLCNYADEYGVEITDRAMLVMLHKTYSSTAAELTIMLLENMNEELFLQHGEELLKLLSAVGAVGKELSNIFEKPSSREEFLDKLEALDLNELDERFAEFALGYLPEREAISFEELEDFKARIVAEYGSLENYFALGNKI